MRERVRDVRTHDRNAVSNNEVKYKDTTLKNQQKERNTEQFMS